MVDFHSALFSMTPEQGVVTALVLLFTLWLSRFLKTGPPTKKGCITPPGPKGWPIIGNALQFDASMPAPQFKKWAEQYGEIFYLKIGNDDMFVLNSGRLVKEALDKRSAIYSSRRPPHVAQDIVSKGRRMIFSTYGDRWRVGRKQAHALVSIRASQDKGRAWQERESVQLLHDLLNQKSKPDTNFVAYFRRYASSVIVNLSFGHRFPSTEDPLLTGIYHAIENIGRIAQPGYYLVDSFPILKSLPSFLRTWEREGNRLHKEEFAVWNGHLQRLIREMQEGTAHECFLKGLLEEREGMSIEEQEKAFVTDLDLAYQVCGFLEAGSDTTASALSSVILALALYPNVLKLAHEELDRVVGSRMPTWEDEANLPYIRAICKEVLRYRPPGFIGTPHCTSEDDILEGIFIPAGSIVVENMWAIHQDPKRYTDPEHFDPSRYLGFTKGAFQSSQEANPDDRDHFTYGAGRRLCVGIHLAEQSLYIAISRMLWAFDIERVKDPKTGLDIPLDASAETGYFKGFVTAPLPYEVNFVPRTEVMRGVLEKEFEQTVAFFKGEGREV